MILFRGIGGRIFCKIGKFVFCIFSLIKPIKRLVDMVYDESKAPFRFLILGGVFVVQGVLLIVLSLLVDE
ncbi:hypothetical protein NT6N_23720 [Oceaniferula spumae]|uniref:DUF2970 domain-containing protein n=1 Tax=Oceaniferula spumae TaxID=2979115 RepID=A0AAT9FMY9_9BACT